MSVPSGIDPEPRQYRRVEIVWDAACDCPFCMYSAMLVGALLDLPNEHGGGDAAKDAQERSPVKSEDLGGE